MIRRLESFSDIVIGFSLAQAALNLVVPAHPLDILIHPVGLFAYLATFAVVATIWWSNTQLFQHYFVPGRLTFMLSLVTLAMTGLLVYALQVWMHAGKSADSYAAAQIYFGALALTYGVLGSLFVIGLISYRSHLNASVRARGLIRCVWLYAIGLGAGLGTAISLVPAWSLAAHNVHPKLLGEEQGPVPAEAMFGVMLGMVAAFIVGVVVRLRLRRLNAH